MKSLTSILKNGVIVSVVSLVQGFAIAGTDSPLFSYKGKSIGMNDVTPVSRQSLFDADKEHFDAVNRVIDEAVLLDFVKEEAGKKKISEEEVKAQLFVVKEPDEKAMMAWFEKNKEKIPYPFEKIKGEISRMLQGEEQAKKRTALLDDLKKKGSFKSLLTAPIAPVFQIASQGYPLKGNKDAKVTIVEFADFQCPHCKHASEVVKTVMTKYADRVKLVYLDFPINPSGISRKVAEGAACADEQNKYWEYHAMAFEKQPNLTATSAQDLAKDLKLDAAKFEKCLASPAPKLRIAKSEEEGKRIGVQGTPAFFINGRKMQAGDEAQFSQEIDAALKG
jgi:protein-disulfide isomerase